MARFVRLWLALVALAVAVASAPAASGPAFTFPVRLGFAEGDDWEPAIAADRFGHVYALWTHYGDDPRCEGCASPHMELQVSSDGGETWSEPRPLRPSKDDRQDDPQIAVDPADGRTVYAAYMEGNRASEYVAKSVDFGQTWTREVVEHFKTPTDKDILAVRGQDVYLGWSRGANVWVSSSHDSGQTWSVAQALPRPEKNLREFTLGSGGAVDSRGTVYFAWNGVNHGFRALGPVYLYVSRSRDGGATWDTQRIATSSGGRHCGCRGWSYWSPQIALAVDDLNRVYVLWNQDRRRFAPTKLFFASSSDGGETWLRRNDVSLAPPGTNHLFPALAARGDGDVRVAWMDDRNGFDRGDNDRSARWNTYFRSSLDGGQTWSAEQQLSRFVPGYGYKRQFPRDGYLEPYGDYFELDIDAAGRTHAIWGEGPSYAGPGNVWYSRSD
jgi:hypothetical protein